MASVASRYFSDYFSRFEVGRDGSLVLFTASGILVARYPVKSEVIGGNGATDPLFTQHLPRSPHGSYNYRSNVDGVERLSGYRRGDTFPLVALAAAGREQLLADWYRDFVYRIIAVAVLVATIASLGWSLARQLRRRDRAEAELSILAATDGLTGLANRRTFDSHLESEWLRAAREDTPLSLLLVDIDYFKAFNDAYGHQAGDHCLRAVARLLQESVRRPADLVARYGGEEIAVLLPVTSAKGATRIAEAIRLGSRNFGDAAQAQRARGRRHDQHRRRDAVSRLGSHQHRSQGPDRDGGSRALRRQTRGAQSRRGVESRLTDPQNVHSLKAGSTEPFQAP